MEPSAPPTAEQIQQNHDALAQIREEVAATQALVGPCVPTDTLLEKYADNPGFLAHVPAVCAAYSGIRTVRGDGICFYRAALVSMGLAIHAAGALPPTLLERVRGAKAALLAFGYSEFCDDFIDALLAYLEGLVAPGSTAEAAAVEPLCASAGEASILYGLRLLTALELHSNAAAYADFIEGAFGQSISDFCAKTVLPSYEEADQIRISALCAWLRVRLTVVSLDAHALHRDTIPEDAAAAAAAWMGIHLLLRPGHYDILTERV